MKTTTMRTSALALAAVATLSAATLDARDAGVQKLLPGVSAQLGRLHETTMYVMTDKPLYHPGETVWFRAWEVGRKGLEAVPGQHGVTVTLLDPGGAKLLEKRVLYQGGLAANDFELPPAIAGGKLTLHVMSDAGGTIDRAFTVSTYEVPRVKKALDFGKKSYGPGDPVTAHLDLVGQDDAPLAQAKVTAAVSIDGAEIARFVLFSDKRGRAYVSFQLPVAMKKGDGLLTLIVDAGGVSESIQRRIPIALDDVSLSAFPEGGDLVEGLPSRVYVAAKDPLGKPVEIEGHVVDDRGRIAAHFKSTYGGMARFELTPEKGRSYTAKLSRPLKAKTSAPLPAAKATGCTLRTSDDFLSRRGDVGVDVACTDAQPVVVTGVLREKLVGHVSGEATRSGAHLALPVEAGAIGALRVTLFDADQRPLAERLVYRGLGREVKVSIQADRASYAPRDPVTLTVETKDADGKPVSADVALAVVDDAVLSFADDKTENLLAALYLLPEMPGQKIEEPSFYFSSDKRAPEAMDLLLGTQGWRRFGWQWIAPVR